MKASFYTESILYWLARALSAAIRCLPPQWAAAFGSAVGTLLYYALPKRKRVALAQLRSAFGDRYTPAEYRRILKRMFQNLGMTFVEVARIPSIDRDYIDRWIEIPPGSQERLDKELAKGKGIIFVTGHFGNWELISLTSALYGYKMLVLAREQGWPRLNRLLTQYRESAGCKVITKGFPIRELIRGLQEKRIVGILSDQDGGPRGLLVPYFGRLASTAPGAIALSINTGAPIIPAFMVRKKGAAHKLIMGEPIEIPSGGTEEERTQQGVAAYVRSLEAVIAKHPEQWLWLHRRWKTSPQRSVLLFSDGKAGHDAQLRAMAQRIESAWGVRMQGDRRLKNFRGPLVKVQIAPVAYRSRFRRAVLSAVASAAPKSFGGGDFWLRWALAPSSYRAIRSAYADISVSCGSAAAPVNFLWAGPLRAKTVQINSSRWPSWRKFSLAVVPRHDRPPARPARNLIIVDGALAPSHKPDPEQLRGWREELKISRSRQIGLLIGGPARGVHLEESQVKRMIEGLLAASERLDAELLVTSSRRTPAGIEAWLHKRLSAHPRCRLLVLVNRGETGGLANTQQAVPCIMGLADPLVVSGDSISMISEALAQSKKVVSFLPAQVSRREPKYHRFLQGLKENGTVTLATPEKIGDAVALVMGNGASHAERAERRDPVEDFLIRWL